MCPQCTGFVVRCQEIYLQIFASRSFAINSDVRYKRSSKSVADLLYNSCQFIFAFIVPHVAL